MKAILSAIVVVSLALNSYLAYRLWFAEPRTGSRQSTDSMVVMRTPGGLLEVSTITAEERFDSTTTHTILGVPMGTTVAQIKVPAVYRYHIPLAKDWNLRLAGGVLIVIAPPVQASLPVAIETSKLESFSAGIWSPITGPDAVSELQKSITQSLAAKAATPQLLALQREHARKTVTEFVQRWVVEQPRWRGTKTPVVIVFFADEPLGERTVPLIVISP